MASLLELNVLRDMLIARVGPDYTESAVHNKDGHVPQRVRASMNSWIELYLGSERYSEPCIDSSRRRKWMNTWNRLLRSLECHGKLS